VNVVYHGLLVVLGLFVWWASIRIATMVPTFWQCGAVSMYCETARRDHNPCGSVGNLWEQAPPRKGVFTRILDWLIGES
jgi:hypothetical protein